MRAQGGWEWDQPKVGKMENGACGWVRDGEESDTNGEALVKFKNCSGYAGRLLGPKLMNRCRTKGKGPKENRKMLKRILKLEKGEFEKKRVTRRECKRSREECEDGRFMAQTGLWNIAHKKMVGV